MNQNKNPLDQDDQLLTAPIPVVGNADITEAVPAAGPSGTQLLETADGQPLQSWPPRASGMPVETVTPAGDWVPSSEVIDPPVVGRWGKVALVGAGVTLITAAALTAGAYFGFGDSAPKAEQSTDDKATTAVAPATTTEQQPIVDTSHDAQRPAKKVKRDTETSSTIATTTTAAPAPVVQEPKIDNFTTTPKPPIDTSTPKVEVVHGDDPVVDSKAGDTNDGGGDTDGTTNDGSFSDGGDTTSGTVGDVKSDTTGDDSGNNDPQDSQKPEPPKVSADQ